MLEMGKKYKWEDIVKEYPDMWVMITDVKEKHGEILSCRLLDVCKASDRALCLRRFRNSGMITRFIRTTESDLDFTVGAML